MAQKCTKLNKNEQNCQNRNKRIKIAQKVAKIVNFEILGTKDKMPRSITVKGHNLLCYELHGYSFLNFENILLAKC